MRKLLIVDDETDLVEALSLRFQASGFEVETAPDGPSGVAKARSFAPDVVLLDVAMPGMSGWDVCRTLRADPKTRRTPVLVMTAAVLKNTEAQAQEAGADGVVKKPFDDRELVVQVRQLAEGKAGVS